MLERVVVLLLLTGGLALGVTLVRAYAGQRTRALQAQPGQALLAQLGAPADGRATLVQFSTPSCAACHTAQAPAVAEVEQRVGAAQVRVLHVDAADQPEIASAFGILTVPSTVVLDPGGRVAAVNHGFASTQQLVRQLQTA
jgi:thiol-disulfide isomerase/thioredoxin